MDDDNKGHIFTHHKDSLSFNPSPCTARQLHHNPFSNGTSSAYHTFLLVIHVGYYCINKILHSHPFLSHPIYIKHQLLFLCHSQSPSIDLNSANKKYNRSIVHTLLLGHTINAKDPLYIGIDFHFTRFHQRTLRVQEFIKGLTGKLNDFHPPSTTVINSHAVL